MELIANKNDTILSIGRIGRPTSGLATIASSARSACAAHTVGRCRTKVTKASGSTSNLNNALILIPLAVCANPSGTATTGPFIKAAAIAIAA